MHSIIIDTFARKGAQLLYKVVRVVGAPDSFELVVPAAWDAALALRLEPLLFRERLVELCCGTLDEVEGALQEGGGRWLGFQGFRLSGFC